MALLKQILIISLILVSQSVYSLDSFEQAIMRGDLDAVKDFVENKNKSVDSYFKTALTISILNYVLDSTNGLRIYEMGFDRHKPIYMTALQLAIEHNRTEVAEFLIEKGARIEARDHFMQTALHYAIRKGNLTIFHKLIALEANVGAVTAKGGHTALQIAIEYHRDTMIDTIISIIQDSGDSIEEIGEYSIGNALHYAAAFGDLDILRPLVEKHKMDVNFTHRVLYTPLALAAYIKSKDQKEKIDFLLEHGADINKMGVKGVPPIAMAVIAGNLDLVQFFKQQGAIFNKKKGDITYQKLNILHVATIVGKIKVIKFFIEEGININILDKDSNTAMHYAAEVGNLKVAKFLAEHGAQIDRKNRKKQTPQDIAKKYNHTEIVEWIESLKCQDVFKST